MSEPLLTGGRKRRRRRFGLRRRAPVLILIGCLAIAFILLWSLLELVT